MKVVNWICFVVILFFICNGFNWYWLFSWILLLLGNMVFILYGFKCLFLVVRYKFCILMVMLFSVECVGVVLFKLENWNIFWLMVVWIIFSVNLVLFFLICFVFGFVVVCVLSFFRILVKLSCLFCLMMLIWGWFSLIFWNLILNESKDF